MSSLRLSLRLPATQAAPGAARHALDGLELYVGDDLCRTIKLLVSELVTNSVRHAGLQSNDTIEVSVAASDDRVRVEVDDPGRGFTPKVPEPDPQQESGWGLVLTSRLAERWGVADDGGARVWFEISPDSIRESDHRRSVDH